MQRGLRLNPQDENLWHEYFRLELLYIEKIKIRRRVLGIDAKSLSANELEKEMEVEDENTIQLPTITGEEIENWNEESEERKTVHKLEASTAAALEDGANPILNGLLAKIIYDNAIQGTKVRNAVHLSPFCSYKLSRSLSHSKQFGFPDKVRQHLPPIYWYRRGLWKCLPVDTPWYG